MRDELQLDFKRHVPPLEEDWVMLDVFKRKEDRRHFERSGTLIQNHVHTHR
jgi:hypothetical protein